MNIEQAKSVIVDTHFAALNLNDRANAIEMLSGPGVGKSDAVMQSVAELAARLREPVGIVTFMLATISSVDVRGFMLPVKGAAGVMDTVFSTPPWYPTKATMRVCEPDGVTWHREGSWDGPLPRAGVVFLDEFAAADDEVKKPAAELLYKGRVGTCELPSGWRVVAASNRMSDRSGVLRAMAFITNRRMQLNVSPSFPCWQTWANAQPPGRRPHYSTLSFAQKNPNLVFRDAVPDGSDPFCTPRTLCLMDRDLQALRSPEDAARSRMPTDALAKEVCAGWIGSGEAAQYYTHLKYDAELPEIGAIEADPHKAKLPPNRDAQMVCGYMLAHHITAKNSDKMMVYVGRLNVEMQVLAVRAILAQQDRAVAITNTKAFGAWLLENRDLLVASRS